VDLLAAAAEAHAKKCKAAGSLMEDVQPASATLEDEEAKKRRKYLQEVLEMEKIADNDEGDGDGEGANGSNGNAKCAMHCIVILVCWC
jgi:hypothetical protein